MLSECQTSGAVLQRRVLGSCTCTKAYFLEKRDTFYGIIKHKVQAFLPNS